MKKIIRYMMLASAVQIYFIGVMSGQTTDKYDFERIEDNSFLIEEAYNQEAGVIQHISTFQYTKQKKWLYTFTQEWPVTGEKHQLSATIPVLDNGATGLSDIAVNYRYQAILKSRLAFSPRFSLLLPTGNYHKGLGSSTFSYQLNLPLSFILSRKIVTHYNLGITITPGAKNEDGTKGDMTSYNYGFSIILLLRKNFNFMFEVAGNTTSISGSNLAKAQTNTFVLNPGVRYAFNFKSGLQIVPGLALPISLGSLNGETSLFTYLSFEHPLKILKNQGK
jgi:hypothetical protein